MFKYTGCCVQRCRRLLYLILDWLGATHAGDVGENIRPSVRRAVPADVPCERGRETQPIISTLPLPHRELASKLRYPPLEKNDTLLLENDA